jgi:uncharacterized iron-regulated membrane protein
MRESTTAILARNVTWTGTAATEPYEAGWASEAIVFVRALKPPAGPPGTARVEISADGMHWAAEGTTLPLPTTLDQVTFARVRHFGNWLRVVADLPESASLTVLVTLHAKE